MVKLSLFNNTLAPLPIDGFFLGAIESTQQEVSISVNVLADVPVRVIIRQYRSSDVTSLVQENFKDVDADVKEVVQTPVKAAFFNVAVLNESGGTAATKTEATTYLQASHYVNLDVRQLSATQKEDSVVCYGVDLATGLKHPLNVDASGSLIVVGGGGGGNFSTPSNQDLDMDSHKIINITELGSAPNQPLFLNNDITFNNVGGNYINNVTNIVGNNIGGNDPYLTLTNLTNITTSAEIQVNATGGVTFFNGTNLKMNDAQINDVSQIRFSDTTVQTTAYTGGGGGGNFSTPSNQDLDMDSHKIINITELGAVPGQNIDMNSGINFTQSGGSYISNVSNIVGNNVGGGDPYLEISNLTSIYTPTGTGLQVNAIGGVSFIGGTNLLMGDGIIGGVSQIQFSDTSQQTTAYQNPFQTQLDMNNNDIINVTNIVSAPASHINIDGIDADSQVSINANTSGIGGVSSINVSPAGIYLNTRITGTEDVASASFLPTLGNFNAPFFVAQGFQPSVGTFQKGYIETPKVTSVERIEFSDLTVQTTAYTGNDVKTITSTDGSVVITTPSANTVNLSVPIPSSITSNTFYVNDNVNNINDTLALMGTGDLMVVSAGTFGQSSNIVWNVPQSGLSGAPVPLPLTFLTTAIGTNFTLSATQCRIANIKFQMPVIISIGKCNFQNCDFDAPLTIQAFNEFVTIDSCEFSNTPLITVQSGFNNVVYFVNCNFASSTFSLNQLSFQQVVFINCGGFVSLPTNASYIGANTLAPSGATQLSGDTIKSVISGGNVGFSSNINMFGNNIINLNNIGGRTGDPPAFQNGLEMATGLGGIQMRNNPINTVGTYTQTCSGIVTATTVGSSTASRHQITTTIPFFAGGGNASFVYNDAGVFSTKSVTLTTGGVVTFPDATTQDTAYKNLDVQTITNTDGMLTITAPTTHGVTIQSAMKKGKATLGEFGAYEILDNTVTATCVCVVTYADDSPTGAVLCAKVQAGYGITIQSTLLADRSPFFYMYFI